MKLKPDTQYEEKLNEVIRELRAEPVDLLSIGDAAGETDYIENSRFSYLRTLDDIIHITDTLEVPRCQIRILEVGAYLGVISCSLARLGFAVTAFDIPEFMANRRLAARYSNEGVATMTANLRDYRIPAESGSFDLIVMCETLEHLNFNPLPVMTEINRLLNDGAYLYLSLPNQAALVNRAKLLFGCSIHNPISDFASQLSRGCNMIVGIHWREYTAAELRELHDLGGFSIVSHEFFTTHRASLPARLAYALFPALRPNQTLLARKRTAGRSGFQFSDATR